METHPILSHVHADGSKCKILNGSSYHFFSIYSKNLTQIKKLLLP